RSSSSCVTRLTMGVICSATLSVRIFVGMLHLRTGVCGHTTTMDFEKIRTILAARGEPPYRFRQVYEGATRGLAEGYGELTALPAGLRETLSAEAPLHELEVTEAQTARDGTIKLGLAT